MAMLYKTLYFVDKDIEAEISEILRIYPRLGDISESKVGEVVRALAFHQYGPGSISWPASYVDCLLVLFSSLFWEVFPRVLWFSPLT